MKKKLLVNILLRSLSISLFILSMAIFFLSIFTLINFFVFNSKNLNYLKDLEIKQIKLFNPGPLNIKELSFYSKIYLINTSFEFLNLRASLKANGEEIVDVKLLNKTLIEEEIKGYVLSKVNFYRNIEEFQNKIFELLNSSELIGNSKINVENILKIELIFKTKLSDIIKI